MIRLPQMTQGLLAKGKKKKSLKRPQDPARCVSRVFWSVSLHRVHQLTHSDGKAAGSRRYPSNLQLRHVFSAHTSGGPVYNIRQTPFQIIVILYTSHL